MPNTGLELGFPNLYDVEMNTHAGTRHLHNLIERMDPRISFEQRVRFALAAYNAGWGHMQDARRLAGGKGWAAGLMLFPSRSWSLQSWLVSNPVKYYTPQTPLILRRFLRLWSPGP